MTTISNCTRTGSIFGGGLNSNELRAAVEEELTRPEDPEALQSILQKHIDELQRALVDLQAAKLNINDAYSRKSAASIAELSNTKEKHAVLDRQCAELEAAMSAIAEQVAALNEQLATHQYGLRAARHEREKLVKAIDQIRRSMESDQAVFENASTELSLKCDLQCTVRMTELSNELEDLLTRPAPAPVPPPDQRRNLQ